MKKSITFKRQPKESGLVRIGNPHQTVDIKCNKKIIGHIDPPNWSSSDNLWRVRIAIKDSNERIGWKWATLKHVSESEEEARKIAKEVLPKLNVEFHFIYED